MTVAIIKALVLSGILLCLVMAWNFIWAWRQEKTFVGYRYVLRDRHATAAFIGLWLALFGISLAMIFAINVIG